MSASTPPLLILGDTPVEGRKDGGREAKEAPKEEETEKVRVVARPRREQA